MKEGVGGPERAWVGYPDVSDTGGDRTLHEKEDDLVEQRQGKKFQEKSYYRRVSNKVYLTL